MKFTVHERIIECTNEKLIGDNADYEAEFTFDSEWDGLIKTARFIHNGKHMDVILENDKCTIPVEMLKQGFLKVGVFASDKTTSYCEVYVRASIKEEAGNVAKPTPDVYAQIIDMLGNGGSTGEKVVQCDNNYRFKYVSGTIYRGSLYSYTQKKMRETGTNYVGLEYEFDGTETHIRFTGATSGASDRVAWCFVDANNEVITRADFVSAETFENVVIEIPSGASKVYINGNNKRAAHLEVRVSDLMADKGWLNQLLGAFGRRISYKDNFAWKEMPTGYFAFTFDDSLDDIANVVDLFESLGVPCCFGCIPERLNEGITATETVGEVMLRAIRNGGEVLAHGDGGGLITIGNVDDENYLFNKFVCNMQKFYDYGIDVRGVLRVGGNDAEGNPNLCNDERTDKWVRLFYDYGDLYGVSEPYNHARITMASTSEGMKAQIDEVIAKKEFCSFIFHGASNLMDIITEAVQYIQEKGGVVCNYAHVYDTFGSTIEDVKLEERITVLEKNLAADGNGVKY